jgi:multiple antibiotic resistance protein
MQPPAPILINALYLLALINPISKVSVLSVIASTEERSVLQSVVVKSSLVALAILMGVMLFGDFVLHDIFHVQIYSLQVAGGIVLFITGLNALRKGIFFEQDMHSRFADMAVVPLACPMIAGPATIAASLALTTQAGKLLLAGSLTVAVALNMLIMLLSGRISSWLLRFNLLGALIRITGLIVTAIGIQMVLDGVGSWLAAQWNLTSQPDLFIK